MFLLFRFQPRKVLLCALFLALLPFWTGCRVWHRTRVSSAATLASRQYVQQAAESLEQQHLEDAEVQLKLAIKTNPENIEARTMFAESLWKNGEKREAILQMELVMRNPEVTPTQVARLAEMYFEQENYSSARKYTSLALKYDSSLAKAWLLQGKIEDLQHRPEEALSAFYQAAFHEQNDSNIQILIAQEYLKLGKPQRALETARNTRKSISTNPSAELMVCEGTALAQLERHADAVYILTQADALHPDSPQILSLLAQEQYKIQDYASAFRTASRGNQAAPEDPTFQKLILQVQNTVQNTVPTSIPTRLPPPTPARVESRIGTEVQ